VSEKQTVFTTKLIEEVTEKFNKGFIIPRNEKFWYSNLVQVKKDGVTFAMSDYELSEYIKCYIGIKNIRYLTKEVNGELIKEIDGDIPDVENGEEPDMRGIHYFAEKYCKIKREDGSIGAMKLRDYQKEVIDLYMDNRFSILCGSRQIGKALRNDSLVFTINGKKQIGDLQVGEQIFGDDGKLTNVIGVYPQGKKDVYRITFSDGTWVECCKEHLWEVQNAYGSSRVLELQEFKDDYLTSRGDYKYYVKVAPCVEYEEKHLSIDPYSLGILLGDGSLHNGSVKFSTADQEIVEHFTTHYPDQNIVKESHRKYDYKITYKNGHKNPLNQELIKLNLKVKGEHKFIPNEYLVSSKEQRVALLQGLMDSDGSCSGNGVLEFCTTSPQLALDFEELCNSLGIKTSKKERVTKYTYKGEKKDGKLSFRIRLYLSDKTIKPFRLTRKQNIVIYDKKFDWSKRRGIANISLVAYDDCTCISVDNDSKLFLTNNFIPTHNTVSAAIVILYYVTFNTDKNCLITANKLETVKEIINKVKSIYYLLPYWLKPSVSNWNQTTISFGSTGCVIKSAAATPNAGIGLTIDMLYVDEMAHLPRNMLDEFYRALYPTVSAVNNSKVILTSTPNGYNLFYKLLNGAERPIGDKQKNNYKSMRVYWWQVPGRYVTYLRLDGFICKQYNIDEEKLFEYVKSLGFKCSLKYSTQDARYEIHIPNTTDELPEFMRKQMIGKEGGDDLVSDYFRGLSFEGTNVNGKVTKYKFVEFCDVSSWKEDAIKDIGGIEKFNQEYDLQFANGNKQIFDSQTLNRFANGKKPFSHIEIPVLEQKTFVKYDELKWIDDPTLFNMADIKNYHLVLGVDLSEGLGQDFSVINIFRVMPKSEEEWGLNLESINDLFKIEQVGLYRCNTVSIPELAELLYLLCFEVFNENKLGVVLEVNMFGGELLGNMRNIWNGRNNYSSHIFYRYKHRIDAVSTDIGIKLRSNKNIFVKQYQKRLRAGDIIVHDEGTILEITTFIKEETSSGNIQFKADSGHDDTVMTIVELSTIFENVKFGETITELINELPDSVKNQIEKRLGDAPNMIGADYSSLFKAQKRTQSTGTSPWGGSSSGWGALGGSGGSNWGSLGGGSGNWGALGGGNKTGGLW
jgi:hypothetical protein